jgi:hypothetical protein
MYLCVYYVCACARIPVLYASICMYLSFRCWVEWVMNGCVRMTGSSIGWWLLALITVSIAPVVAESCLLLLTFANFVWAAINNHSFCVYIVYYGLLLRTAVHKPLIPLPLAVCCYWCLLLCLGAADFSLRYPTSDCYLRRFDGATTYFSCCCYWLTLGVTVLCWC